MLFLLAAPGRVVVKFRRFLLYRYVTRLARAGVKSDVDRAESAVSQQNF
jgi:hypothetical protein